MNFLEVNIIEICDESASMPNSINDKVISFNGDVVGFEFSLSKIN